MPWFSLIILGSALGLVLFYRASSEQLLLGDLALTQVAGMMLSFGAWGVIQAL